MMSLEKSAVGLVFNNNVASQVNFQKHLEITLDFKLTFK